MRPLAFNDKTMKHLFEINTGYMGESYVRVYAWAESEAHAIELAKLANPQKINAKYFTEPAVTKLLSEDTECFATKLSDSSFTMEAMD